MATNDKHAGPQMGQWVLYNNAGTTVPAIIYVVNASTWVVSLVYFNSSGATAATGISHDPALGTSNWKWMTFF